MRKKDKKPPTMRNFNKNLPKKHCFNNKFYNELRKIQRNHQKPANLAKLRLFLM